MKLKIIRVPLSAGKYALIDAADLKLISKYNWCAQKNKKGNRWYAYAIEKVKNKQKIKLYMHRLIVGALPKDQVDHRNITRTLDNRRINLRLATKAQNMWNKGKHSDSRAPYKGITFVKTSWIARIAVNKKHIYLGSSPDPKKAALLYDVAAKKYHKEYAFLNFPNIR